MDNPPVDGEERFAASITALREAWVALIAALREIPDPQARFDAATRLEEVTRQLEKERTKERGAAALAIAEAESLSLTGLAKRISVSKQRAGKMTEEARKGQGSDDG